jgi:hypothetical protein
MADGSRSGAVKFFSWAWKILLGVLALAGGISTAASRDFRRVVADAAEWLYPFWLVILLAGISLALLVALLLSLRSLRRERQTSASAHTAQQNAEARLTDIEQRAEPGRMDHDVSVLRAIRETLPRGDVDYWRDHDMGGPWHGDRTHHLMELLYDHNAIEDRFIDEALEAFRVELFEAADALMGKCAQYGIGHKTLDNHYELGDSEWRRDNPPEGERYERFEARREELNKLADDLVAAYDALMSAAPPRLPGAFSRS